MESPPAPAPPAPPVAAPAAPPAPPSPPDLPTVAPPPPAARAGSLALRAVLVAAGLGILAFGLVDVLSGEPLTLVRTASFAARLGLGIALVAPGLDPHLVGRWLRAPRLATAQGLTSLALVAAAMYFIFGLGTAVETARLLEQLQAGSTPEELVQDLDKTTVLVSLTINFLVFLIPSVAWAAGAEGNIGRRAWHWLGLKGPGTKWSVIWSLVCVLLVFWFLIAAGLGARIVGEGPVENERAEAIARGLDLPSIAMVALLTGVGEEVFFRGFLLRKVGNVPQAILFGLAHLNYLQVLEVVVTAALGYGFGRTVQKTGNLWGPVLGHAAFNAVSLFILLAREQGYLSTLLP